MNQNIFQNIQQIKSMMKQVQMVRNPNLAIQQMAQQNPQMQQILEMCQGQNPKDIFYGACKQQGINPEEILNMLRE